MMTKTLAGLAGVLLIVTTATAKRPIQQLSFGLSVPEVTYGGYTTATVTPDPDHDDYVNVQCFIPDFSGTFVYSVWFDVVGSDVVLGPIPPAEYAMTWQTPWPPGPAECTASHGYFDRNGFGRYRELASTTFHVNAP